MRKEIGSALFGTNIIKEDEYILLAKVIKENDPDMPPMQTVLDIEAIDDMLTMQRMQSFMNMPSQRYTKKGYIRKNATYMDWINTRMDKLLYDSKTLNPGF